ncbi:C-type lectin domain family 4 member M-like [Cheilinus undulatus]|uniref:C-type lectin domain family 4 member M-like n=1 Tax=Cheilinus undulatus TaxID=241271 RepID=UPI001BD280DF|nr:C-type lectin domain family 4 member M-like [Cheilinus undulatus]
MAQHRTMTIWKSEQYRTKVDVVKYRLQDDVSNAYVLRRAVNHVGVSHLIQEWQLCFYSVPLEEVNENTVQEKLEGEQTSYMNRFQLHWKSVLIFILAVLTLTFLITSVIAFMQEKSSIQREMKLQIEIERLRTALHAALEKPDLLDQENRQLKELLRIQQNNSMQLKDENERQRSILEQQSLLLSNASLEKTQLKAENERQRSILLSNKLSFLWEFCNKQTLLCSRCIPGWTEHSTRCFTISTQKKWQDAREDCMSNSGDLAVVLNPEDQAFLTNLTFRYVQEHPEEEFLAAWIGLEDMVKEDKFKWVNGRRLQRDLLYWRNKQPDNVVASWDTKRAGQDCVAIVPPKSMTGENWLKSWDDITCVDSRHYICWS